MSSLWEERVRSFDLQFLRQHLKGQYIKILIPQFCHLIGFSADIFKASPRIGCAPDGAGTFPPPAALCLQCIHEEKADDCLCSFDDLLQRFPLVPHGVPKLHLSEFSANPVQACVADSWIWPSSTPMKSCRSFFTGFFDPAQVFRFSSFKSYEGNTIMFQANKQTNQNLM